MSYSETKSKADKEWLRILRAAGLEPTAYSGRGMNGRECVSVSTDNPIEAVVDIAEIIAEKATGSEDFMASAYFARLRATLTDNLGRQTVMYWPSAKWSEGMQ